MVADHSLFINEMLMHGDNAKLASNLATWLCEGRKHLVFIEDGQVEHRRVEYNVDSAIDQMLQGTVAEIRRLLPSYESMPPESRAKGVWLDL